MEYYATKGGGTRRVSSPSPQRLAPTFSNGGINPCSPTALASF